MSIAFMLLSISRSFVFEPVAIRLASKDQAAIIAGFRDAVSACAVLVAVACLTCLGAGVALAGAVGSCLLVTAALLPLLLFQDCCRLLLFVLGRQKDAAISDGIWVVFAGVAALQATPGKFSAAEALGIWMAGGVVAAGICFIQIGGFRWGSIRRWRAEAATMSGALVGDALLANGLAYLIPVVVAAVAGLSSAGQLRVAQSAIAPLGILIQGIRLQALPNLANTFSVDPTAIRRRCLQISTVSTAVAIAATLTLWMTPNSLGALAFGNSWRDARTAALWLSVWAVAAASSDFVTMSIKAAGRAIRVVRIRAWAIPLQLLLTVWLTRRFGAVGTSASLAIGAIALSPVWWRTLFSVVPQIEKTPHVRL
jgi:O-antigen/teichoic acid export membrane protein